MKIFARASPRAAEHLPINHELIYQGKVVAEDMWWGEASGRWLPVRPLHIGLPISVFAQPIARLREDET